MTVSANAMTILAAVSAVALTSKEVAASTGLSLPVVTGSLAGLKKLGFVEVNESQISLTEIGRQQLPVVEAVTEEVVVAKVNKASIAKSIFSEMIGQARKDVLAAFVNKAGLTKRGAETYFYNLTKAAK